MNGYIAAGGMRDEGTPQERPKQRRRLLNPKSKKPHHQHRKANDAAIYIHTKILD